METKITTVSLAAKEDKYYADKTLYQWNYGQILRIIDADLPMAVEVGFSTTEKQGDSDVRVGTTNNGVTTVAIPNKLFKEERSTDYSIYAFVYVTDEDSGTTVHEIVIPVKARAKQGDPSEDPTIDPSIFKDAVNAVNASANRAEAAEKSARESAAKAKGYAESAGKSKEDVENARDDAITSIGTAKESALRGIASKTDESVQKIQSQTEESHNSIKQSIADATEKKTELDGAINNATDAKGNLDKAVQSAGNAKSELDASVGKAGEAKTALDNSISSAEEKKLALDTTTEHANTVDTSLKEQIGSAEQIQANVEQIGKNKADISSLNEELAEVQDKKITKFYASNQGETHLVDSDNGKIMDMKVFGKSSQDGTPTPENPVEIKSVVNPTVKVSNEDGTESQTATLPYTLNAVPVSSCGNVTIDGQQYIADYVDVEKGKLVRMCKKKAVPNNVGWILQVQSGNYKLGYSSKVFDDMASTKESIQKAISNLGSSSPLWSNKFCFGKSNVFWINPYANNGELTSNDINNFLTEHPMEVVYPLITPIEEELTLEEITAFKALATYYPTTNISVNSEQLDGYTVFNYPISMANGWNYVKQQLNDNRDYIYDMDTKTQDIDIQSAEAYVNSEYAVALTELEV